VHFSLCDFVLDVVQNSVEAGADLVNLVLDENEDQFVLQVEDNGCGMNDVQKAKALDPFYTDGVKHRARKVGLGLPFLKQALDETDGLFRFDSVPGEGTKLNCRFDRTHLDTPPVGDVSSLIMQCMMLPGTFELHVIRRLKIEMTGDEYELSRRELEDILGDFSQGDSVILLRQFLRSQEEGINQGDIHG